MAKSKVDALNDYLNDDSMTLDEQIMSSEQYDNESFLDGMSEASKKALYEKTNKEVKEEDMNTTPTTIMDVLAQDLLTKIKKSNLQLYNFSAEQVVLIVDYIETKLKEK